LIDTTLHDTIQQWIRIGNNDPGSIERNLYRIGYRSIAGVDEAGRGPLAGPVVAAAVIFPSGTHIDGVRDSKLLSPHKRTYLAEKIREKAISVGMGVVEHSVIDRINILRATNEAVRKAVESLDSHPDLLLIDGKFIDCDLYRVVSLVKGDRLCHSVAAASVIAKTERDLIMRQLHLQYPQYGFDRHKGYPTAEHREAIALHGFSPVHRRTFHIKHECGKTGMEEVDGGEPR
jgi:ribonuclease HII